MEKVKTFLPSGVLNTLRKLKMYTNTYLLFWTDRKNFLTAYAKNNSKELENIKARMIFYGHSIEKGLSRENIRLGFGKTVIVNLLKQMEKYTFLGFDREDICFINSASIVNEYLDLHDKNDFEITYIPKKYTTLIKEIKEIKSDLGGAIKYVSVDKIDKQQMNFKELALNRSSIRDYNGESINKELIIEAISIATKSPSVCNRQSSRVYVITSKDKIEQALSIQGGFKGYNLPPCLILVTSDICSFIDVSERHQPYIDGGIFSMSLVYALEYQGYATCILNTMFDNRKIKKTKELLNIPSSENLILYISVGNSKSEYTVPKSFRYPVNQISRFYYSDEE